MNETKKTIIYGSVAVVLAVLAFILAPKRVTPEAFIDQGEPFYPEFTNPNDAQTLEVISFDESTGSAHPFKVTFQDGRWVIPSHYDYPADAKDRLAKTAAGVIGIKKDDYRTDNVSEYESLGVIDPLDESVPGLAGRGERVTIKGANDKILADLIIGKPVEGHKGMRFVRVPDQKRVYACQMDLDISTQFKDWIDTDLLQVNKSRIDKIVLNDYSINERTGSVNQKDNLVLSRKDNKWRINGQKETQEADSAKIQAVLTAIDSVTIVGVRPKPEGLSASLQGTGGEQQISQSDVFSLRNKGFFIARNGQLMSNEGELVVSTADGVVYTLRFGEVTGDASGDDGSGSNAGDNRYLFVTARFEPSLLPEPPLPTDTTFLGKADSLMTDTDRANRSKQQEHQRWESNVRKGRETADNLNARFADWYYVISGKSFDQLRLKRSDLLAAKS